MAKQAKQPKQPKQPKEPKQKTRAKTRLKQKVQKNKSHNVSEDLTKLTEDYNAFCTRLQGLVNVRRNIHIDVDMANERKNETAFISLQLTASISLQMTNISSSQYFCLASRNITTKQKIRH